jgi:hypothetical protein
MTPPICSALTMTSVRASLPVGKVAGLPPVRLGVQQIIGMLF